MLAETPLLYQEVSEIREGYRRSACREHAIYYRLDGDDVEITRDNCALWAIGAWHLLQQNMDT